MVNYSERYQKRMSWYFQIVHLKKGGDGYDAKIFCFGFNLGAPNQKPVFYEFAGFLVWGFGYKLSTIYLTLFSLHFKNFLKTSKTNFS